MDDDNSRRAHAFLGLGGNIGNSISTLKKALACIAEDRDIELLSCAPFYRTSPVSAISQGDFTNTVVLIATSHSPLQLLYNLQSIEKLLGKKPKGRDDPRIVDIDILFYGDITINHEKLTIPHPRWQERLFVLKPLSDIVDTIKLRGHDGHHHTISIKKLLDSFVNLNDEVVEQIPCS